MTFENLVGGEQALWIAGGRVLQAKGREASEAVRQGDRE